jgi:hypothetical protein
MNKEFALNKEEFQILEKEYGYKLNPCYDNSGDGYTRSDKLIGYEIHW